jgi:BMFP domain-containing protein YqiC
MSNAIKKALFVAPAAIGAALAVSTDAIAQSFGNELSTSEMLQQIESYSAEGSSDMGQFTGASQFSDVSPSDWAFQALDDLVRRYDCLKGYPNGTYRGNRALSRYEFAAGLNACLQQIERLIAETTADFVTKEDLEAIRRLMQDFEAELAALGTRVDALESRVAFLEDNQFSTTTKLNGQVVWHLGAPFGGSDALFAPATTDRELTFDYRARLAFDTSFTGKDRLRTRLDTGNNDGDGFLGGGVAGSNGALNMVGAHSNNVNIDKVWYRTPINDKAMVHLVAQGALVDDLFDMSAAGYAYDNIPIGIAYNTNFYDVNGVNGGAAAAVNFALSDTIGIDLGYFAEDSSESSLGVLSGAYAIPVQLNFDLGDKLDFALGYMFAYTNNNGGSFGTGATTAAGNMYGDPNDPTNSGATTSSHYMAGLAYDLSDKFQVSAFANYVNAVSVAGPTNGFDGDAWSWAINFAMLDLAQEGDVLSFGFGQLPSAQKREGLTTDSANAYMANLEYRFNVNDHIQLTPGAFAVFNPDGGSGGGETVYAAVLRTIFSF